MPRLPILRFEAGMNPKDVMKGVPRQKHSLSLKDNDHASEEENVETLMEYIRTQNRYGDLELAPGDEVSFNPIDLAERVQRGED